MKNMKNMNSGIGLLLCLLPFGFACVGDWSTLTAEDGDQVTADGRPVVPDDASHDTQDKVQNFCEGPACDGQTPQGPELETLLIVQSALGGVILSNVHVSAGELIANDPNKPGKFLTGSQLKGAMLWGPLGQVYRIRQVVRVADQTAALDSSTSWHALFGNGVDQTTHLYSIEYQTGYTWMPACSTADEPAFADWAIPMDAMWHEDGSHSQASLYFSFACMNGVVAKCYRWGYRPWVDGDMRDVHQACTRMARADYCGNGASNTVEGTPIYIQDYNLATMIRTFAGAPPMSVIEGLWGPDGAYCASQRRAGTDWPDWEQDLNNWCGASNAYGIAWQTCDPDDPMIHGLANGLTPYLANKSEWEPPITITP